MRFPASRTFAGDAKGGVAVVFGLVLPALMGFAGLAVDASIWVMERSKLQAATDSASLSAAQTVQLAGDTAAVTAEARKLLTKVYGASLPDVRFTVQHPPLTGPLAGNPSAVAVLAERDQSVYFMRLFGVTSTFVATRSVARVDVETDACVLALSKTADKAINVSGSASTSLKCGIASNSLSSQAVYLSGSSNTTVSGVSAVGDIYQSNGAVLVTENGPPKSYANAIVDPYGPQGRNLTAPKATNKCDGKNLKVQSDTTLSPGRYCGGIDFTGGVTTFSPGVYIIDGGDFNAKGNASLVGTDVTFILTGKANTIGVVKLNGGGDVSLEAPKTGADWKGILFFKDSASLSPNCNGNACSSIINGNANLNLSGAVYMPTDQVTITGGSSSDIACLQVVSDTVTITGNSAIKGHCQESDGTEEIKYASIELME